jgi:hypothetical protein
VAQASIGVEVAGNSQYVWRGLTLTNRPVLQPALLFNAPLGPSRFTIGVSPNFELGQYDGATDISMNGGTSSFDLTELDYFARVGADAGVIRLSGGINGLYYPDGITWGGQPELTNTIELMGRAELNVPLHPQVQLWYDIDKVQGLFLEAGLGHRFHLSSLVGLHLDAVAGFSAGQERNPQQPAENFWFRNSGFTHARFSAALPIRLGAFELIPNAHFQVNNDPFTKWTKRDAASASGFNSESTKAWFGVTLGWSRGFGGAPR